MSTDEERAETAGGVAVAAVLTPVLSGTFAVICLLIGSILKSLDPEPTFAQTMLTTGWVFGALSGAALLVGSAGLLLTALRDRQSAAERESGTTAGTDPRNDRAGRRTLNVASFVAGERRAHLREEWASILAGDPGNGIVLSPRRRLRYAVGFLWAALRMRLRDLIAPLWVPVDWLLSVESRTHGFIAFAVGAQVVYIEHEDGFHALVTEGWGWCAGCGIALRLFVGRLRRIRGIELASAHGDPGGS
ncbi:hypothetical protein ACQ86D_38125 [Streptomyces galilaeus]